MQKISTEKKKIVAKLAPLRPRRGTREGTRERLLHAAIELIRESGIGAVSTVSVTRRAGFTQSSFYRHFTSVDECLSAAAEIVAAQLRSFIAEHRRQSFERGETDHYQVVLHLFVRERAFSQLWLRHRHDPSPLGPVLEQLHRQILDDLITDLWGLAEWSGIEKQHYPRIALQAEFILASVMTAGENLLSGRVTDVDLLAEQLSVLTDGIAKEIYLRYKACSGNSGGIAP